MKSFFPIIAGLGLVAAGIAAVADPVKGASLYGLPVEDKNGLAFVRGCGTRDAVAGLMLLARRNDARGLVGIAALIGVADLVTLSLSTEAPPQKSLVIHGVGTAGLFLLALLTPSTES